MPLILRLPGQNNTNCSNIPLIYRARTGITVHVSPGGSTFCTALFNQALVLHGGQKHTVSSSFIQLRGTRAVSFSSVNTTMPYAMILFKVVAIVI